MSLSSHEFWDGLGGEYSSFLAPSFQPHLPKNLSPLLISGLRAEVPASLETSESGPPPSCHCAAWPRLSQLDTLSQDFRVLKELQEIRHDRCHDSKWPVFSSCRTKDHSCDSCRPEFYLFPKPTLPAFLHFVGPQSSPIILSWLRCPGMAETASSQESNCTQCL